MKQLKCLTLLILSSIIFISGTDALSCSNSVSKDLGEKAGYVKASYEVIDNGVKKNLEIDTDKTIMYIPDYTFDISIYNIVEDLYVTVKDNIYDTTEIVYNSDTKDGVYSFESTDFGTIHTYTITVLSNASGCAGQKIRTITLITPKYNAYSRYKFCETSSSYYCQKFVTKNLNITSYNDFINKIAANNEQNNPANSEISESKTIIALIKEHWVLYIILFLIIILVVVVIIMIIKKKNKTRGWRL